jgi:hypothetical protein
MNTDEDMQLMQSEIKRLANKKSATRDRSHTGEVGSNWESPKPLSMVQGDESSTIPSVNTVYTKLKMLKTITPKVDDKYIQMVAWMTKG